MIYTVRGGTVNQVSLDLEIHRIHHLRGVIMVGEAGPVVPRDRVKMLHGKIGRDGTNEMPKVPRNQDLFRTAPLLV